MYVYNSYDRHNSTCLSFCHIITCMCKQCKPGSLSLPDYTKVQLQVWSAFSACNRSSWCKHNVVCLSPTGGVESLITVATVGIAVASTAVVTFIAGVLHSWCPGWSSPVPLCQQAPIAELQAWVILSPTENRKYHLPIHCHKQVQSMRRWLNWERMHPMNSQNLVLKWNESKWSLSVHTTMIRNYC